MIVIQRRMISPLKQTTIVSQHSKGVTSKAPYPRTSSPNSPTPLTSTSPHTCNQSQIVTSSSIKWAILWGLMISKVPVQRCVSSKLTESLTHYNLYISYRQQIKFQSTKGGISFVIHWQFRISIIRRIRFWNREECRCWNNLLRGVSLCR